MSHETAHESASRTPVNTVSTYDIGASEDVPERGRLIVEIGPTTLGVFRFHGRLHAWENVCAHQGGPACQGRIIPRVRERLDRNKHTVGLDFDQDVLHIVCPWHGAEYDVTTGRHPGRPDWALRRFDVVERDGRIHVTV